MRSLFSEYLAGAADLMAFYAKPPEALFDTAPATGPWDMALAEAMGDYQSHLGKKTAFRGNEAVIITGQQPGIFTGPLYTIYKAITAVKLAAALEARHGVPCVPVFWIGSEDHDFQEARSVHVITRDHRVLPIDYAPPGDIEGRPMYRVPLNGVLHNVVDELAAETVGGEFRDEITAFLHDSLNRAESLADWTALLLGRLFRDTPLVLFAPHLAAARKAAAPIFEREIREPLRSTALLNETARRLDELGFPPQVIKGEDECNFFLLVNDRRRKVLYEDGMFIIPEEELRYSGTELLAMLQSNPERFSPNVALRCIVQQHVFPTTVAYVAGPGEIAYWAQLKPLFEFFEKPMPIVYPRVQCTLVSLKLTKLLAKSGLKIADLSRNPDELLDKTLRYSAQTPALDHTRQAKYEVAAILGSLAQELQRINATAANMVSGFQKEVERRFDRIERTLIQGDQTKLDATKAQLARLLNSLYPTRKPQERVLTIFSFLFEHGWDLMPRLIEAVDVGSFAMQEIEL